MYSWIIKYVKEYGKYLNTKESWNLDYFDVVYNDTRFSIKDNDWYEIVKNFRSFNDFFSRRLKSPDMRQIADKSNNFVVVHPIDGMSEGGWRIDMNTNIVQKEDSPYRQVFDGGYLTHIYLEIYDYHRFYFPVSGTVKEVRIIEQDAASGGFVSWDLKLKQHIIDSRTPGWQSIETKEYVIIALLPVVMSKINSVKFKDSVKI